MRIQIDQLPETLRMLRGESKLRAMDLEEVATRDHILHLENGTKSIRTAGIGLLAKWFDKLGYTMEINIIKKQE